MATPSRAARTDSSPMPRTSTLRLREGLLRFATVILAVGWIILGGHDALLASRPQERLVGTALLLSGLAALTAVTLMRNRARLALAGFIAGSTSGILLATIQTSFNHDYRTWAWLLTAAFPACLAVITAAGIRRQRNPPSDAIVAALLAAMATALVPLLGILGTAFRPVRDAEILNSQVEMSPVAVRKDSSGEEYVVVEVRRTVENISKRRLVVIGSFYTIRGTRSFPRPSKMESEWDIGGEIAADGWSGRYEDSWRYSLVETGFDFFDQGYLFEPGQRETSQFYIIVPARRINTIKAHIVVVTAFADRLSIRQIERPVENRLSPDRPVSEKWEVEPTSWMAALTRGRPVLEIERILTWEENPEFGRNGSLDRHLYTNAWFNYRLGENRAQLQQEDGNNKRISTFYGTGWTAMNTSLAIDAKRLPAFEPLEKN